METPAQLAQRVLDAADWGHCLECGCDVDALAGEVLCGPCDAEATEHDARMEELAAVFVPRLLADLAQPEPVWTENNGRWTCQPPDDDGQPETPEIPTIPLA